MAPPPADLTKIGVEGFALIDKFFGPQYGRSSLSDAFPGRREGTWVVYQVPNGKIQEPPMNSRDAAVNYPKAKPQHRWGRPIKP